MDEILELLELVEQMEKDSKLHKKRDSKLYYLVIDERKLGGFDVYLNPDFPCAGGRKLNRIGMETHYSARALCEAFVNSSSLNCEIIEHKMPEPQYPIERSYTPEYKQAPLFNHNHSVNSKFFLYYLGAIKKNWRADDFVKHIARLTGRKYCYGFVRDFLKTVDNMKRSISVNLAMQEKIRMNFGIVTLPEFRDSFTIPHNRRD